MSRTSRQPDGDQAQAEVPDFLADADGALIARLGALLKEQRVGRYTIEGLAARAGISAGLISQIERGIGNPSFSTLARLSYALGVPLGTMFEGPNLDEHQMVVRRAERRRLAVPGDGTVHETLVADPTSKLGVMLTVFPPKFPYEKVTSSHPGEEFVLVMSGTVSVKVGGQEFVLEEGDSLIYDSALPHVWANPGDKSAEVMLVSTPPASGSPH
jgi:quercetin dioxygenase-like cupin family protein/DNA-binding phage protein